MENDEGKQGIKESSEDCECKKEDKATGHSKERLVHNHGWKCPIHSRICPHTFCGTPKFPQMPKPRPFGHCWRHGSKLTETQTESSISNSEVGTLTMDLDQTQKQGGKNSKIPKPVKEMRGGKDVALKSQEANMIESDIRNLTALINSLCEKHKLVKPGKLCERNRPICGRCEPCSKRPCDRLSKERESSVSDAKAVEENSPLAEEIGDDVTSRIPSDRRSERNQSISGKSEASKNKSLKERVSSTSAAKDVEENLPLAEEIGDDVASHIPSDRRSERNQSISGKSEASKNRLSAAKAVEEDVPLLEETDTSGRAALTTSRNSSRPCCSHRTVSSEKHKCVKPCTPCVRNRPICGKCEPCKKHPLDRLSKERDAKAVEENVPLIEETEGDVTNDILKRPPWNSLRPCCSNRTGSSEKHKCVKPCTPCERNRPVCGKCEPCKKHDATRSTLASPPTSLSSPPYIEQSAEDTANYIISDTLRRATLTPPNSCNRNPLCEKRKLLMQGRLCERHQSNCSCKKYPSDKLYKERVSSLVEETEDDVTSAILGKLPSNSSRPTSIPSVPSERRSERNESIGAEEDEENGPFVEETGGYDIISEELE